MLAGLKAWVRERFPGLYRLARSAYHRARYAGRAVACPICRRRFRAWIVPDRRLWHQICPGCGSLPRQRLIWLWLERETGFFKEKAVLLHVAPELGLQRRFRALPNLRYLSTDIKSQLAEVHADLTQAPWEDASFDVILCNHVLEHIPDDRKAMAELHRLLRPGGWGLVLVPFQLDEETFEDPDITSPDERVRAFGQQDHVRRYGRDYLERLAASGFDVEYGLYARKLGADVARYHGLQADEFLIVIRRPADADVSAAGKRELLWDTPASGR